jgi:histidinol phosphatase-like enzyme
MFKLINKIWKVDKNKSFMISDQKTDMKFATRSGIKGFFLKKKICINLLNQKNLLEKLDLF